MRGFPSKNASFSALLYGNARKTDNMPMDQKGIFNATVCIIGIAVFLIHSLDLFLKKNKRKDEKNLLAFFIFTAIHFSTYLIFTIIKSVYTSNPFIIGFYTTFYVMNNVEILFLFAYALSYIAPKRSVLKPIVIINLIAFGIFIILDFANIFGRFLFTAENGAYVRGNFMLLSQGYQMIGLAMVFFLAVLNTKLSLTEKLAFSFYCVLPLVGIIIQNALPGYAIAYLSIVISIEVLYLFANMRKNAALAEQERKNKEAEIRLMMSQIQPHFIYNTLSSISTLIQIDPDKAQRGLDDFTDYLRTNLSSLSETNCISFSDELRHIETYISLEMIRFDERLDVIYEIEDEDFMVPPLSIQPLVENAVKHGILQKLEGGTITLRTYQTEKAHVIEIEDDGIGFNVEDFKEGGTKHIGLQNVRSRISSMVDGTLDIESEVGKGTKITVTIYKEGTR